MEILVAPHPKLRVKTKPVKKITPEIIGIARKMIKLTETFTDPEGVGLSANQIGREDKFFIAKLFKKFLMIFNPQITSFSKTKKIFFEACLSVPNFYGEVERPTAINIQYQDEKGQTVKKPLKGIAAWIFQHEMDHLNGILFVDRVLEQKRRMFKVVGKDRTGTEIFEEVKLI